MLSPGFENISIEELKKYIDTQEEKDYLLIDVRRTDDDTARSLFLTIAQVEKSHMQMLANAVDRCP